MLIRIIMPSVSESTASNRVDNNEKHKEYDIEYSNPLPVTLDIVQQPGFAGFTAVTQDIWIVAPQVTVWIVQG